MDICYSIEGIPLIIRFKTEDNYLPLYLILFLSIEGIPVIIRFKTKVLYHQINHFKFRIEGIPLITRFKTNHS